MADQLRQKLLTWSDHVTSWIAEPGNFPVHVVRYEDMLLSPQETFAGVVRFCGLPFDAARLNKALRFSSFDVLQQQESANGFSERVSRTTGFFRKGRIGSWKDRLTPDQARQIIRDHRYVLERLGYVSAEDIDHPDEQVRLAVCSAA